MLPGGAHPFFASKYAWKSARAAHDWRVAGFKPAAATETTASPKKFMKRRESVTTPWQRVEVWRSRDEAEFRVEGAAHAWWHRHRLVSGLAWDNIAAACLLHPGGNPADILMLGLGGGTGLRLLRALLPCARFTAVEIDPVMVGLARKHMSLDKLDVEVIEGDARVVARDTAKKFDVVVDDLYLAGAEDVVRCDRDGGFLGACSRLLHPHGIVVANLVTGPGHRKVQSAARREFLARFPVVKSVTTPACWNECIVGGVSLEGAARLRTAHAALSHPTDRALWDRLSVRRLCGGNPDSLGK